MLVAREPKGLTGNRGEEDESTGARCAWAGQIRGREDDGGKGLERERQTAVNSLYTRRS